MIKWIKYLFAPDEDGTVWQERIADMILGTLTALGLIWLISWIL